MMVCRVEGRTPRAPEHQSHTAGPPGKRCRRVAREEGRAKETAIGGHAAQGKVRPKRCPGAHLAPSFPTSTRDDGRRARDGVENQGEHALWGTLTEDCVFVNPLVDPKRISEKNQH